MAFSVALISLPESSELGFVDKSPAGLSAELMLLVQDLDRDVAAQEAVVGKPDGAA